MSPLDLLTLSSVPGLSAGVKTLESTYIAIENVKLYKQQCKDICARCVKSMVALREGSKGLEGTKAIEVAHEIGVIIDHIDRKIREWSCWSQLKSFVQKKEIKEGIDRLHREIDAASMNFTIQMNMEMARGYLESEAIRGRDKVEIREVLHIIVKSTDYMKALLTMQSSIDSQPVEEVMESLQMELMDPSLQPSEKEDFKAGLWMLHEETSKFPPLTDLTGQVTLNSQTTIARGSSSDLYLGQWLDKQPVALRLPRNLANDSELQDHFRRQASIWREFHHLNVVPLYGVINICEDLYSVSPWMDNGTAVAYVKKFPSTDRMKILTGTASGLEYLHSRGVVHGDLRGANVMISKDGTARLSDFGLSKFLEDCGKATITTHSINPRWFAPELVHSAPVSTHSDVWSFGMLCLEILSGELPYSNITRDIAVLRELDKGKLPERPGRIATSQGLTDDMWDLMEKCWQTKPASRPSISDIKATMLEMRDSPSVSTWTRFIPRKDSRPSLPSFSLPVQLGTDFPPEQFVSYDRGVSTSRNMRSISTSRLSCSIREVVSDPRLIVNVVNGVVSTGTLEGLVHRLITNINLGSDIVYRDALLTACADFATPEDFFAILSRRFLEAEAITDHPEGRVAVQCNIFMVVMYWLSHQYLQVDNLLLLQMKQFCQDAIRMKSPINMANKARDLLQQVENREQRDTLSLGMPLAPGRKLLQASQIKPQDLAIALTLLEGDKYNALVPSDYIAHLRGHPGYNNVKDAYTTNNKIILWVKESILHENSAENRAAVLRFFIHTAMECRKLRNFSSLVAIAIALHSPVIEQLRLTRSQLTSQLRGKLESLYGIVDLSSNHRGYRQALNEINNPEERNRCIPWLAVHLKEVNLMLPRYPKTVEVDGRPLINFQGYLKFMEHVKAEGCYRAPDLERYRQQGCLDFLENQLRLLDMLNTSEDYLTARSKELVAQEGSLKRNNSRRYWTITDRVKELISNRSPDLLENIEGRLPNLETSNMSGDYLRLHSQKFNSQDYRTDNLSRSKTGSGGQVEEQNRVWTTEKAGSAVTAYSLASSRTASTDYGLYYTRWAISQDSMLSE